MLGILAKSPRTFVRLRHHRPNQEFRVDSSSSSPPLGATGKTSFESVRVRVHLNTSSAGLTELELGFEFELSARIELELELFFQLRPWGGGEIGRCRAPLLVSYLWLGWLFSRVLSHYPVIEAGPQTLAHVDDRSTAASLCPVCRAWSRRSEAARHVWWPSRTCNLRRLAQLCRMAPIR